MENPKNLANYGEFFTVAFFTVENDCPYTQNGRMRCSKSFPEPWNISTDRLCYWALDLLTHEYRSNTNSRTNLIKKAGRNRQILV